VPKPCIVSTTTNREIQCVFKMSHFHKKAGELKGVIAVAAPHGVKLPLSRWRSAERCQRFRSSRHCCIGRCRCRPPTGTMEASAQSVAHNNISFFMTFSFARSGNVFAQGDAAQASWKPRVVFGLSSSVKCPRRLCAHRMRICLVTVRGALSDLAHAGGASCSKMRGGGRDAERLDGSRCSVIPAAWCR
jgi:hypothetical protein